MYIKNLQEKGLKFITKSMIWNLYIHIIHVVRQAKMP